MPLYPTEVWRPVLGCLGEYEVSSRGRVRSLPRETLRKNGSRCPIKERILKPFGGGGEDRAMVWLRGHSRKVKEYVYRLVLEAFVGACPEGLEGCHNNGNPHDHRLENLCWDTRSNNQLDRHKHGTMRTGNLRGQAHGRATLTDLQVKEIRRQFETYEGTKKSFATSLELPEARVYDILSWRSWKHLR